MEIHDGVVRPDADQAVVAEDAVTEAGQFRQGIIIIPADGGARHISAGHDQAVGHGQAVIVSEKQVLKGRVGQHDADGRIARRHGGRDHGIPGTAPLQEQDGLLVPGQDLVLCLTAEAFAADRRLIPHHDREGLGGPALACAQPAHRGLIGRVTTEVETADSLDRDDAAVQDRAPRRRDGIPADTVGMHAAPGGADSGVLACI